MNLRQLEAFRATMLAGTMNGAADQLGLSQPSVSRLITQLEHSLDVTLFDRANGRLTPTPEGRMIHDQVEHAINALSKIRELAADVKHARVGNLSIACMPALGVGFLPAVIEAFCAEHPHVNISLDIQASVKVEDWIAAQQIDFGLAELPYHRDDVGIDEFCNLPYYAVMPREHPLARKAALTPGDFEGLPFVSMTSQCQCRHLTDQYFSAHGVSRVMRVDTSYLPAVCELVALGLGVGFADPFNAHTYLDRLAVRRIVPGIDFKVGLLYPSHRPMSKVGRRFISFMKQHRDRWLADVAARA